MKRSEPQRWRFSPLDTGGNRNRQRRSDAGWDGRTRTYNIRVKVWCVTVTLHPTIDLGREAGIAGLPHLLGWEMGLEPTTPGTTIRCSYQLSYTHHLEPCLGTPGGTRTPGLLLRRQLLYPAELLAQMDGAGDGNRTRIPSLEGWCPGHCATPARALRNLSAFA